MSLAAAPPPGGAPREGDAGHPVAGATDPDRARRVAGALAEAGVIAAWFSGRDGSPQPLAARQTDLPGLLQSAAPPWALDWIAPDGARGRVWRVGDAAASPWRWRVTPGTASHADPAFADLWTRALGAEGR